MSLSLYPFGAGAGDKATDRSDDGGSGQIKLKKSFTFYETKHTQLFVNNNGVISFLQELRGYRPKSFPLEERTPIIAPFWADVDVSKAGGTVWYRETQNREVLDRCSQDVRGYASDFKRFQARWAFVVTWDNVSFYGASDVGETKRNTFQCVLVSDRSKSFAIFLYDTLQWTTGSNSQGNSDTGLGGKPAQAGFNAGDRVNYHTIDGAGNDSVINLTQTSNMCSPGKWVFRVDSAQIVTDSGSLLLAPSSGSMLGGYQISITGPCFSAKTATKSIQGRLGNTDLTFPCSRSESEGSGRTVHCVMPTVFVVGEVAVSLSLDGERLNYTGVFTFENPGLTKPQVIRHSPKVWLADERVRVSWQRPSVPSTDQETVLLEVLTYREVRGVPRLKTETSVTIATPGPNDKVELQLPSLIDATLAVVRIREPFPLIDGSYISYWSDVFPVRWKQSALSESWCLRWLSQEQKAQALSSQGACPCIAKQADSDTGRWQKDWLCHSESSAQCIYRGSLARECFVSTFNSSQTVNQLCCYGDNRELLNLWDGGGGSMVEQYHFSSQGGQVVPWFSYLSEEVAPFLHCCDYSSNDSLCGEFSLRRPQLSCQGYNPPAAAQAAGDPHLVTLDGLNYTFNGEGDFVLLQDVSGKVKVHVHAARAVDIDGQLGNATLFTAVAMSVVNETQVVEIRKEDEGTYAVLVDQQEQDLTSSPTAFRGITLYHNETGNGSAEFTVVLDTAGISVLVSVTPDLLNIMVLVGSPQLKGKLEGLLGNYNGVKDDDLRSRQGQLIPITANMSDIHYRFGMTWYLERKESLLYHPDGEEDSGVAADTSFVPVFMDSIKDSELRNGTAELCQGNLQCMFDYQLTGKESIGQSTKQFNNRFESVVKEIAPVVRCPYIQQPENGNRTLEGQAVGDRVFFSCKEGFKLTNDTTVLVCLETGKWSGSVPDCVVDLRQDKDNVLLYIAIGSAFGGFVLVIVFAVLLFWAVRKCRRKYIAKHDDTGPEPEQFELPRFFDPSASPNPVFDNPRFVSSLQSLKSEEGRFQIPRPRYVDPDIHTHYF